MLPKAIYEPDIYSDQAIADPYPHYAALRQLASAVLLPAHDLWAISRYDDVRAVLNDSESFSSAHGVAANDVVNEMAQGTTLFSDPPLHQKLRQVITRPLVPAAVEELRQQIGEAADALIERLVARKSFDGVVDLARFLPISIVSTLVGLPEQGRENMLDWAAATFELLGPMNERATSAMDKFVELVTYARTEAGSQNVRPGSWAARIYQAADDGLVSQVQATSLLLDYLGPSLDTTIFATGHMLHLFATNPEQWKRLKQEPDLINNAVRETIRLESPIRGFTRYVTRDTVIGDSHVAEGSRVLVLYASANRDERKWEAPDRFDIARANTTQHLGFGSGRHICAGMHLAQLEIRSLLRAMLDRIDWFEVEEPVPALNNTLRGFSSLPMRVYR